MSNRAPRERERERNTAPRGLNCLVRSEGGEPVLLGMTADARRRTDPLSMYAHGVRDLTRDGLAALEGVMRGKERILENLRPSASWCADEIADSSDCFEP